MFPFKSSKYYAQIIASSDNFSQMGILFPLLFALLLLETSSIRLNQEVDKFEHDPPLRLPLYHASSSHLPHSLGTPMSFLDTLSQDVARVKFLNSRLSNKNLSEFVPEKSVRVPLNPGVALGIGNYYTRIGLGTPPTYHFVVVDTGSSFSWVQCEPCAVYCHPQIGSHFNPSASNTYQRLSCNTNECSSLKAATLNSPMCTSSDACLYTSTYGDQSFSVGYLSRDALSFGTESISGFVFGCGQDNDGRFGKSAGLFGLAKNELSMLSQLSKKYGKSFSYCLPSASPFGKTGSGGFLSIGMGSNSGYKFTPMLSDSRDPSLYFLKLSAIKVSGKLLNIAASGYNVPTIIDSGTTISRLSAPAYSALREELVKIISSKYKMAEAFSVLDACFIGSFNEISPIVPPVQLIFQGGAELNLAAQNVILEVEKGTTCLSIAGSSNLQSISIIGNQQQQTFEVVYDLASSRIGFAAGGCS